MWHKHLTDLSTSPVRCSHFTLGNPKSHFSPLLFIYSKLFTLPRRKQTVIQSSAIFALHFCILHNNLEYIYNHNEKWLFGFPKVKWLYRTGEVDKSVRCSCHIFSGFGVYKFGVYKLITVCFFVCFFSFTRIFQLHFFDCVAVQFFSYFQSPDTYFTNRTFSSKPLSQRHCDVEHANRKKTFTGYNTARQWMHGVWPLYVR